MAGTLTVQNIQGPSSGANANKIIIPSGQTLDASAGTFVPSAGGVLQVVQTQKTDTFSSSSTTYVDVTGMSVNITPSSTSSKILIMITMLVGQANSNFTLSNLLRDGVNIAQPTTSSTFPATLNAYPGDGLNGSAQIMQTLNWLDSPSTTSQITYKIQSKTTGGTFWVNARPSQQNGTTVSSITLMEIAG